MGQAREQAVGDDHHLVPIGARLLDGRAHREHLLRGDKQRLGFGRQDAHRLLLHVEPRDLIVVGAERNAGEVLDELLGHDAGPRLEQDRFDAVLVGGAPDVGPLAVQCPLELGGGRRDVVREEKLIFDRDANALHVDARGRVVAAAEDGSDVRTLQLVIAGEA
ncbi:MAG: hypothetical protein E6I50_10185 [Chloroflexi bacterium]|nr:MAG: hypothetical protein E6I50_10185 [Chloroflexota bacterium]